MSHNPTIDGVLKFLFQGEKPKLQGLYEGAWTEVVRDLYDKNRCAEEDGPSPD